MLISCCFLLRLDLANIFILRVRSEIVYQEWPPSSLLYHLLVCLSTFTLSCRRSLMLLFNFGRFFSWKMFKMARNQRSRLVTLQSTPKENLVYFSPHIKRIWGTNSCFLCDERDTRGERKRELLRYCLFSPLACLARSAVNSQ